MPQVHAVPVEGVRSQLTSDRRTGLLHFQRTRPDPHGSRELNIAVPAGLLPYVAAAALEAIPQPQPEAGGALPVVIKASSVQPGLAPDGAIVLTIGLDMGAQISFAIDPGQAEGLQQTLSIAIGRRKAQALRASAAARKR